MSDEYFKSIKKTMKPVIEGVLPAPIYRTTLSAVHRILLMRKMVLAAVNNAHYSGQFQTALREKPYDHRGRPFLWYSPSMMDLLKTIDFKDKTILEFGAGHSTLWWSRRAKSVVAIEDVDKWYEYLQPLIQENVELVHVTDDPNSALNAVKGRKFDFIIVDCNGGVLSRDTCNEWSTDLLTDDGAILFDNSEEDYYKHESIPMFKQRGFSRVDFYGIASTKAKPQCSSVLFKKKCFLWESSRLPVKLNEFDDDVLAHTPYKKKHY